MPSEIGEFFLKYVMIHNNILHFNTKHLCCKINESIFTNCIIPQNMKLYWLFRLNKVQLTTIEKEIFFFHISRKLKINLSISFLFLKAGGGGGRTKKRQMYRENYFLKCLSNIDSFQENILIQTILQQLLSGTFECISIYCSSAFWREEHYILKLTL